MRMTRPRLCTRLLLAGALLSASHVLRTQNVENAIEPISGPLAPSFTANEPTSPVTSLSPDMLVSQHPFLYDATGADISSTAVSPNLSPESLNLSAAQLDISIRDSSQAGQMNPFASGSTFAGRLALRSGDLASFAVAGASLTGTRQTGVSLGSSAGPMYGGYQESWRSSWMAGQNSEAGATSTVAASSWGVQTKYRGNDDNYASAENTYEKSLRDFQPNAFGYGSFSSESGAGTLQSKNLAESTTQTREFSPFQTGATPNDYQSAYVGRRTGTAAHVTKVQQRPATLKTAAAATTIEDPFLFSARSYAGYSFGQAPFGQPSFMDQQFLQPNILNVPRVALRPQKRASIQTRSQMGIGNETDLLKNRQEPRSALEERSRSIYLRQANKERRRKSLLQDDTKLSGTSPIGIP